MGVMEPENKPDLEPENKPDLVLAFLEGLAVFVEEEARRSELEFYLLVGVVAGIVVAITCVVMLS